jgi:hypothetical protein
MERAASNWTRSIAFTLPRRISEMYAPFWRMSARPPQTTAGHGRPIIGNAK